MKLRNAFSQLVKATTLAVVLLFCSMPGHAAMIDTAEITRDIAGINLDAQTLQQDRLWIEQQLVLNGVDTADASLRVSQLSDAQVHHVRHQFDDMPAGAGVVGVVIIVGVALLVTDLLGLTDVFPGIRPIN